MIGILDVEVSFQELVRRSGGAELAGTRRFRVDKVATSERHILLKVVSAVFPVWRVERHKLNRFTVDGLASDGYGNEGKHTITFKGLVGADLGQEGRFPGTCMARVGTSTATSRATGMAA